jgi:tRNA threonylcarbamoyladenosine biosynthesis protein TsaE
LGAGKTQLAKGVARGLGFAGRVHSPTFTLVNEYAGGRLALFHVDLYRLATVEQIEAAGLEEYLHPAGVSVIEWVEKLFPVQSPESRIQSLPAHFRRVQIETVSENERRIIYEDFGA